jgi:hypothetical protein
MKCDALSSDGEGGDKILDENGGTAGFPFHPSFSQKSF